MSVKVLEAREHCKAAEKYLKTTLMRWKPDYDSAADEYSQAAQCYRIARDLPNSKECHMKAADCFKKNHAMFHAAKALENAMIVCKETAPPQEIFDLAMESSVMYQQHGSGDSGATVLDKAGKILEQQSPELACKLFQQAADVSSNIIIQLRKIQRAEAIKTLTEKMTAVCFLTVEVPDDQDDQDVDTTPRNSEEPDASRCGLTTMGPQEPEIREFMEESTAVEAIKTLTKKMAALRCLTLEVPDDRDDPGVDPTPRNSEEPGISSRGLTTMGPQEQGSNAVETESSQHQGSEYIGKASRLLVKLKWYDQAVDSLRREIGFHQESGNTGAIGRLTVAIVLVQLARGDAVAAEKAYKEWGSNCEVAEMQTLEQILQAYDEEDRESAKRALASPFIRNMDVEYARLAATVPLPEAMEPAPRAAVRENAAPSYVSPNAQATTTADVSSVEIEESPYAAVTYTKKSDDEDGLC